MLVERNAYGAIVIFGDIGFRQYYGYTQSEAERLYSEEVRKEGKKD